MIDTTYYGTLDDADTYFAVRLNESAWTQADSTDRPKALWAATLIIDTLNYKGHKAAVWQYLQTLPCLWPTPEQRQGVRAAEASQQHEFPRGSDTEVPQAIETATYEMAHTLLDGVDPELELQNLGIISHGYGSARTMFDRDLVPVEHLVNGVPNSYAWRLIRPFLRDDQAMRLFRVS
jgi:hypothetical protein